MLYDGTILFYYLANYLYTQGFLLLSLEMGSVTQRSWKMGNTAPDANKKWVACRGFE